MTEEMRVLLSRFAPPSPPSSFVDRVKDLAVLRDWIDAESSDLLVVTGIAGIGKTSLAAKFAEIQRALGWNIIWLGSERSAALAAQSSSDPDALAGLRNTIRHLPAPKTLLVLDDEVSTRNIRVFSAALGSVKTLVTTRDAKLSSVGPSIVLGGLPDRAARDLIQTVAPSIQPRAVSLLAERSAGNPLILTLVSRAMLDARGQIDAEGLIALLDRHDASDIDAANREVVGRRAAKLARDDYTDGVSKLENGQYEDAVAALTRAVSGLSAAVGPIDSDTLAAQASLGEALRLSGRAGESLTVMEELVRTCAKNFPPNDSKMLTALLGLAGAQRDSGDAVAAQQTLEELLPRIEEARGSYHPDTITALSSLAVVAFDLGDTARAVRLQEDVLSRLSGEGESESESEQLVRDPQYVGALSNLGQMLAAAGAIDRALDIQLQVVSASQRVFGPDHPDTLTAYGNLASTYSLQDRHQEARALEEMVLERRSRVLGPSHPDTLAAKNNLAYTLAEVGSDDEAIKLSMDVVSGFREQLASNPRAASSLLGSMTTLATTLLGGGKWSSAMVILNEAVDFYNQLPPQTRRKLLDGFRGFMQSLIALAPEGSGEESAALREDLDRLEP